MFNIEKHDRRIVYISIVLLKIITTSFLYIKWKNGNDNLLLTGFLTIKVHCHTWQCFAGLWSLSDSNIFKKAIESPKLFVIYETNKQPKYHSEPKIYHIIGSSPMSQTPKTTCTLKEIGKGIWT